MIMVERRTKFELSKDIRYLALTGELLREYCEYFGGKTGRVITDSHCIYITSCLLMNKIFTTKLT